MILAVLTGMKRYRNIKLDTELNETEEMFFEDFAEFDDSEEFNEDTYADEAFDEALIEE